VENDPRYYDDWYEALNQRIFYGPKTREWHGDDWDITGKHKVVCEVQLNHEPPVKYTFEQVVRDAGDLAKEHLSMYKLYGSLNDPSFQLNIMKYGFSEIPNEETELKEEYSQGLTRAESYLAPLIQADTSLSYDCKLTAILTPKVYPVPMPLRLYLKKKGHFYWSIVDVTDPTEVREYDGFYYGYGLASLLDSSEHKTREAIRAAWDNFVRENKHPAGQMVMEPPEGFGFGTDLWSSYNNGMTSLEFFSQWLVRIGFAVGIAALILTPIPGTRALAGGLIITAGVMSAAAASMRILDRVTRGKFKWDLETAMDIVDIIGGAAGAVGAAVGMVSRGIQVGRLTASAANTGRGILIASSLLETGSDVTNALLVSASCAHQIRDVMNSDMTPEEKARKKTEILQWAALVGGLTLLSLKGTIGDISDVARQVEIDDILTNIKTKYHNVNTDDFADLARHFSDTKHMRTFMESLSEADLEQFAKVRNENIAVIEELMGSGVVDTRNILAMKILNEPVSMTGERLQEVMTEALNESKRLGLSGKQADEFFEEFAMLSGAKKIDTLEPGGPIYFGQQAVGPSFSDNHPIFAQKTLQEVSGMLKAGTISPDEFPIFYVVYNGRKVTLNNRSLTLLSLAGMKPTKTINATGSLSVDPHDADGIQSFLQRMRELPEFPMTKMPVRYTKAWDSEIAFNVDLVQ
jgi:hypothetical protein